MTEGFNIALKINNKTILGRTQDDLTIAARTKESLTKDDEGETQSVVTGHDVTFKASALMVMEDAGTTGNLTRDALLALVLATGENAKYPIRYEAEGGSTYGGNAIITNYSESSNASDNATLTIDFKITGSFAIVS